MYSKDLCINLKVRVSETDYDFVNSLSKKTGKNISTIIREIIEKEKIRYGYIKRDIDNQL